MPPSKKRKSAEIDDLSRKKKPDVSGESDAEGDKCWRDKCRGIRDIKLHAFKNTILSDVTFLVGPSLEVFQAHRMILALGSPVFEAMFFGPLAEKNDTITIPDVDPDGFHYFLMFLYADSLHTKDDLDLFKTAFAADKYCVTCLKEKCEAALCAIELTPSNVWMFFQNAIYLNSVPIKKRCFCYFAEHLPIAMRDDSFLEVNANTLRTLLDADFLDISEDHLLENAIEWARHNCKESSFKEVLKPILRHIRFGHMQAKDFVYCMQVEGLKEALSTEDALLILQHILQPQICRLPDWCCSKAQRNKYGWKETPARPRASKNITFLKNIAGLDNVSTSSSTTLSGSTSDSTSSSYSDSD